MIPVRIPRGGLAEGECLILKKVKEIRGNYPKITLIFFSSDLLGKCWLIKPRGPLGIGLGDWGGAPKLTQSHLTPSSTLITRWSRRISYIPPRGQPKNS